MAINHEIEGKFTVSSIDFQKLIRHFNIERVKAGVQTNYYFDTINHSLLHHHWAMRVRNYGDHFELTIKSPLEEGLQEINEIITSEEFSNRNTKHIITKDSIKEKLRSIDVIPSDINFVATLTTYRRSLKYLDGELFFDESHYNGIIDYEIEYEVNDTIESANAKLIALFKEVGIANYSKSDSKMRRAILTKKA